MTDYTPSMARIRWDYAEAALRHAGKPYDEGFAEFDRALAAHDAEVRAAVLAEQGEGQRWFAACWRENNGTLSVLGWETVVRADAELQVESGRSIEAEGDRDPERIVLGAVVRYPWLPVPADETEGDGA